MSSFGSGKFKRCVASMYVTKQTASGTGCGTLAGCAALFAFWCFETGCAVLPDSASLGRFLLLLAGCPARISCSILASCFSLAKTA